MQLRETVKSTFKDAAKKLTGNRKRDFMAKVTEDYFKAAFVWEASHTKRAVRVHRAPAETVLGWNRHSVQRGLHERKTGIICLDNYQARGCHKSEFKLPNLERDIHVLVDAQAQADPKFQTTFCYARISARAVRETLIRDSGYTETELPTRQTIGEILNRLGYRLKKPKRQNP